MATGHTTPRDQLDRLILLARRAMRWWWLVGLIAIVGGAGAAAFAMTAKTRYQSETVILYRELIPISALQGSAAVQDNRNLGQRVRDMLFARPRLQQVVEEMQLYPEVVEADGMVEAVDLLRQNIVFRARGSGTFHLTFSHPEPEMAQKVTARLADLLIEDDTRLRVEQANVTTNFLRAERDRAEGELRLKEKELAEFLAQHPEFAQESPGGSQFSAGSAVRAAEAMKSKQRAADPRVGALERQRERIVARLRAGTDAAPVALPRPSQPSAEQRAALQRVEAAKRDVDGANRDLERNLSLYTDKHPDVVAAKKRLAEAQRRLAEAEASVPPDEAAPIIVPPANPNERAELEKQLAELDRQLNIARRAAVSPAEASKPGAEAENWVVALETDWQRLNREVQEARERHQQLEGRLFTAQIAASSAVEAEGARMQIIDPAFLPTKPAGTPKKLIVLAGLFVFFAIGCALALGLALIDDRLLSRWDVEKLELLPVLVVVPKPPKARRTAGTRRARSAGV